MSLYCVVIVLGVLSFISSLGGNTPVDYEFDSDDWYAIQIIAWVAVFMLVALLIWAFRHLPPPPPPHPPVDDTASVDKSVLIGMPNPGIPNQFIGFASAGKIGFRGIDDGISPNSEERRVKSELAVLRAELERMKTKDQHQCSIEIIGWVVVFIIVAGVIWTAHPPPPPPPVDATASLDDLEPSPGIPNQFIGFASSGKIRFRGIDDGISPNYEERGVKSQVVVLRAELKRMKKENQHLRDLLNQVAPSHQ